MKFRLPILLFSIFLTSSFLRADTLPLSGTSNESVNITTGQFVLEENIDYNNVHFYAPDASGVMSISFDGGGVYSLKMTKNENDTIVSRPGSSGRRDLIWMRDFTENSELSLEFKNLTTLSLDGTMQKETMSNGAGVNLFGGGDTRISIENVLGDVYLGGFNDASVLSSQSNHHATIRIDGIKGKLSIVNNTAVNMSNYAPALMAWSHKDGDAWIVLSDIQEGVDISFNENIGGKNGLSATSQYGTSGISFSHISGGLLMNGNKGFYGPLNAIGAKSGIIQLENISGDVVFTNNNSSNGGVVTIAGIEGETVFGIRNVEGNVRIVNNSSSDGGFILFQGNSSSGGIFTLADINGDVLFSGNSAKGDGGAIASLGNSESDQGFVEMTISADGGDIVFEKNMADGKANAIYAQGRHRIALSAADGRTLSFYDPLLLKEGVDSVLDINKSTEDRAYGGKVVFSGARVDGGNAASLRTEIDADINIHGGILSVEDNAVVRGKSLIQDDGRIMLSSGGTLGTDGRFSHRGGSIYIGGGSALDVGRYSQTGGTLVLSAGGRLASAGDIGISSLTLDFTSASGALPEITTTQGTLKIDGSITVLSSARNREAAPVLYVQAAGIEGKMASSGYDRTVIISDLGLEREVLVTWDNVVDDAETGLQSLTFYSSSSILGVVPEQYGSNVANSMLSSASNMEGFTENTLLHVNPMRFKEERTANLWTSGLGDFSSQRSRGGLDGYDYQGGGYSLGIDRRFGGEWLAGLAFGQLFGKNMIRDYHSKIEQNSLMGIIYGAWLKPLDGKNALVVSVSFGYGNTDNDLTSEYEGGDHSSGKWDNDTFGYNLRAEWQVSLDRGYMLSPYIELQYTGVVQDSFTENGDRARRFGKGHYRNMAIPVGLKISRIYDLSGGRLWYNAIDISYVGDAYRDNPGTDVILDGYGWAARGVKSARNAVKATFYSNLQLSSQWSAFCGYTFEGRSDASAHQVNLGAGYSF